MVNNSTGQSIVCVQSRPVFQGYREQNLTATKPATEAGNFGNISLFHYGLSSCQQAHMQCEIKPKAHDAGHSGSINLLLRAVKD